MRQKNFTATWSQLVHDQKKSSQNVQKLDFENFIENPRFWDELFGRERIDFKWP